MQCALPTCSQFPSPHRSHSRHTFFAFANIKTLGMTCGVKEIIIIINWHFRNSQLMKIVTHSPMMTRKPLSQVYELNRKVLSERPETQMNDAAQMTEWNMEGLQPSTLSLSSVWWRIADAADRRLQHSWCEWTRALLYFYCEFMTPCNFLHNSCLCWTLTFNCRFWVWQLLPSRWAVIDVLWLATICCSRSVWRQELLWTRNWCLGKPWSLFHDLPFPSVIWLSEIWLWHCSCMFYCSYIASIITSHFRLISTFLSMAFSLLLLNLLTFLSILS